MQEDITYKQLLEAAVGTRYTESALMTFLSIFISLTIGSMLISEFGIKLIPIPIAVIIFFVTLGKVRVKRAKSDLKKMMASIGCDSPEEAENYIRNCQSLTCGNRCDIFAYISGQYYLHISDMTAIPISSISGVDIRTLKRRAGRKKSRRSVTVAVYQIIINGGAAGSDTLNYYDMDARDRAYQYIKTTVGID